MVDPKGASAKLLLLRHGQVASHQGDLPLTDEGRATAIRAGRLLGARLRTEMLVYTGTLRRARQTAELFVAAAREASDGAPVEGPRAAFALRNPDLYLAGERVDMVSSAEALAQQVSILSPQQCATLPFFAEFIPSPDRIGYWLRHSDPPGDHAATVAARIGAFARSLLDMEPGRGQTFVGITFSPILRSLGLVLGQADPGEPRNLTGLALDIDPDGSVRSEPFDPFA